MDGDGAEFVSVLESMRWRQHRLEP
jgi:hypothetical protein